MTEPLPVVLVTRCGIGIFDMQWWEARLLLLRSVTLPSVVQAAKGRQITWFLLIDEDIPSAALTVLRSHIEEAGGDDIVRLLFVRSSVDMNKAGINAIRSVAGDHERVMVMRIDDDDAVAVDAFSKAEAQIKDLERPAVITLSDGYAFNAPAGRIGRFRYPSHPSNTFYYGTVGEISKVLWKMHTKALQYGQREGFATASFADGEADFIYTFHPQGDGSYEDRVAKIDNWQPIDEAVERFGIDLQHYRQWIDRQEQTPPTVGLTWRRTMPEVERMRLLDSEMCELKSQMVAINSRIFDANVPFVYLVKPPTRRVEAGTVWFEGAASPGARVSLKVTGKSGHYRTFADLETDPVDGSFRTSGRFNAGVWNIRVEVSVAGGSNVDKVWDFQMVAR